MTHGAGHFNGLLIAGDQRSPDRRTLSAGYWARLLLIVFLLIAAVTHASFAADDLTHKEEQAIKAAVARVAPSVVRIETVGGLELLGEMLVGTGPTTGLVVSDDGYIVSSAFNFAQKPDTILVTLSDGTRLPAKLVASDHSRMIVLLKVAAQTKLSVPEAMPKSEIQVGAWAIAVGRAFEGSDPNISVGIISGLNRIWGKAVQTDAKISPNNYGGPLVDVRGRVLGVLVPMSPEGSSEAAGVEWYDSGIGFAIPLEQIMATLPKLREGHDLSPGILGISLASPDLFTEAPVIAACRPNSPAHKAGLKAGDKIVEAGGHAITRQAELKHELSVLYAGDKLSLVVLRGKEKIAREVELVDKLPPYEHPFLGVLPMRPLADRATKDEDEDKPDSDQKKSPSKPEADATQGVILRYVYPNGPAAKAGLKSGDAIVSLQGAAIGDLSDAIQQLRELAPGEKARVDVRRGSQKLTLEVTLGRLPEELPTSALPPAHAAPPDKPKEQPAVGVIPLKAPEIANECFAYVPAQYDPRVAHGAVVWLHAPGDFKRDEILERWRALCDKHDLILLAIKSTDPAAWPPTEARTVRRMLDELAKHYHVDPARTVIHGQAGGGALAYLVGLASRNVVAGVAAVEAPLPGVVHPPENDPVHRFAIYTTLATKSNEASRTEAGIRNLRAMKYPVIVKTTGEQSRYLTADELAELARWIDTLDRL